VAFEKISVSKKKKQILPDLKKNIDLLIKSNNFNR